MDKSLLSGHQIDFSVYEGEYKELHANPGLSLQETFAATTVTSRLNKINESLPQASQFSIHTNIGGHGVAAVLQNGPGSTVLLRADMDALPVEETTGLEYASKVWQTDADGIKKPVMHACGHDMHTAALLSAADMLAHITSTWSGTLVLVFQPNEERGGGAKAMVEDGLYKKVPVPDVVLGQHVMSLRNGRVEVRSGTMMAASNSLKITLFGKGGHGSMPHNSIDPVYLGANVVQRLQGIVSREVNPSEPAVVTVGSIQAGQTVNIIPDKAVLQVSVRSQSEATRKRILESIERIVKAECLASGCVQEPVIERISDMPLTVNDVEITGKIKDSFEKFFGEEFNPNAPGTNASEDVSILATSVGKPICYWFLGGVDGETWDKAEQEGTLAQSIPANHSSFFAPTIQPTLRVGMEALCVAALTFLGGVPSNGQKT